MSEKLELRIAHLYAHFLNIYGDRGNIISIAQRCKWRGINPIINVIGLEEDFNPDYYDFFFIGGGQDKQQQTIAQYLYKQKELLSQALNNGSVILAVCGGYQLLGHYYRPAHGEELKGLSIIDAYTQASNTRMIGNVVVKRDNSTLVGFENHSGKTFLSCDVCALGKVLIGNGNNGEDKQEGCAQRYGQGMIFGTYLHGSLLPKNPTFADEIIRLSLSKRYGSVQLKPLDDFLENQAHERATKLKA